MEKYTVIRGQVNFLFFLEEINTLQLIKSDGKNMYNTKDFYFK